MRNKNQDYEETKRNTQLYKDYISGKFTTLYLQFKYKISATRIYQLIDRYKKKNEAQMKGGGK